MMNFPLHLSMDYLVTTLPALVLSFSGVMATCQAQVDSLPEGFVLHLDALCNSVLWLIYFRY
jgi:hypothetical protein